MSLVSEMSSFANASTWTNLSILSLLDDRSLQAAACVSRQYKKLVENDQIWRSKAERAFGKMITDSAKANEIGWKKIYQELALSKKARIESASEIDRTLHRKVIRDNVHHRTTRIASALLGIPMPEMDSHYYPTGQSGHFGNNKFVVYRLSNN